MDIVSYADSPSGLDPHGTVYTVHIGMHRYVDVMYRETGPCYVMETADGSHIYGAGNHAYGRLAPDMEEQAEGYVRGTKNLMTQREEYGNDTEIYGQLTACTALLANEKAQENEAAHYLVESLV